MYFLDIEEYIFAEYPVAPTYVTYISNKLPSYISCPEQRLPSKNQNAQETTSKGQLNFEVVPHRL